MPSATLRSGKIIAFPLPEGLLDKEQGEPEVP